MGQYNQLADTLLRDSLAADNFEADKLLRAEDNTVPKEDIRNQEPRNRLNSTSCLPSWTITRSNKASYPLLWCGLQNLIVSFYKQCFQLDVHVWREYLLFTCVATCKSRRAVCILFYKEYKILLKTIPYDRLQKKKKKKGRIFSMEFLW